MKRHITSVQLDQLNKRGWEYCEGIWRSIGSGERPDLKERHSAKWGAWWSEYWTIDRMIEFLESKGFTILGTKDALIGVMLGIVDTQSWFPPAIGDDPIDYLWRMTCTALNTLDTFGHLSTETLEALGKTTLVSTLEFK